MKLISFIMAVPVAALYIIALGTVVSIGVTVQLLLELLRGLRKRKEIFKCPWCGRYVDDRYKLVKFSMRHAVSKSSRLCNDCCREFLTHHSTPSKI